MVVMGGDHIIINNITIIALATIIFVFFTEEAEGDPRENSRKNSHSRNGAASR